MTSLTEVAAYLPPVSVPIEDLGERLGLTGTQIRLFRRFHGLSRVLRAPGATHADLMLSAADRLETLRGEERRVRYLVHARALQSAVPEGINPLLEVKERLGLTRAQAFTLTQHACATGLLAVDLCGRLLAADGDPDALALVLTGEPAFTPSVELTPDTTIMGEGAAAILVSAGGTADRVLSFACRTRGEFNGGLWLREDLVQRYHEVYPEALAEVILDAVERAGLALGDIEALLPHNVNRVSWVRLCKRLDFPVERVFLDNIAVTGHCFTADPFINHQDARLTQGRPYLMAAVGRGSTFAAMVLEH